MSKANATLLPSNSQNQLTIKSKKMNKAADTYQKQTKNTNGFQTFELGHSHPDTLKTLLFLGRLKTFFSLDFSSVLETTI